MSTKTKTLAKSLHTVTALVAVARLVRKADVRNADDSMSVQAAVNAAAVALGYRGAVDPYDLKGRAVAILSADG